jgi:hypothetical protein
VSTPIFKMLDRSLPSRADRRRVEECFSQPLSRQTQYASLAALKRDGNACPSTPSGAYGVPSLACQYSHGYGLLHLGLERLTPGAVHSRGIVPGISLDKEVT